MITLGNIRYGFSFCNIEQKMNERGEGKRNEV